MSSMFSVLFDERNKFTPEHRLWFQVLYTYVTEAKNRCKSTDKKCRQGKTQLRSDLDSTWTMFICDLVDQDYKTFKRGVLAILGESCPIHSQSSTMNAAAPAVSSGCEIKER